jgi:hypothetical protein
MASWSTRSIDAGKSALDCATRVAVTTTGASSTDVSALTFAMQEIAYTPMRPCLIFMQLMLCHLSDHCTATLWLKFTLPVPSGDRDEEENGIRYIATV